jgi:hypothetical protein
MAEPKDAPEAISGQRGVNNRGCGLVRDAQLSHLCGSGERTLAQATLSEPGLRLTRFISFELRAPEKLSNLVEERTRFGAIHARASAWTLAQAGDAFGGLIWHGSELAATQGGRLVRPMPQRRVVGRFGLR